MSITDELRDCIRTANRSYEDARNPYNDREILHIPEEELTAIADRIDAEHAVKVERLEQYRAAVDAMLKEYVKLPVDAEGVPIKLGDVMETGSTRIEVIGIGNVTSDMNDYGVFCQRDDGYYEWFNARFLHHVQPDSWERIMDDAEKLARGDNAAVMELVERCRRLAGEGE